MRYESKKLTLTVVACCLVVGAFDALAGTGFYVGKKVSADGTTMIGRMVDAAPWNGPLHETRFERGEWTHADGTSNKYAFICAGKATSRGVGYYGGGAFNEKGVMLSATVTARTNIDAETAEPFVAIEDGGYGESNLPDLMIGNAATAREAVEILGEKIAAKGHSGPEIYMVADADEAWYIEVYTGYQWAAVKMPEDQVAVFGNQFNIREFNTNDTANVMYSPNLIGLAAGGFAQWKDDSEGIIDLYATYSPPLWDYANYRTWWGHNAWAPSEYPTGEYETSTAYPLFFDPEEGTMISLTDVFELMRAHYDGVGTTKQQSCHVLQLRHDLSADYRCTLWEGLAPAEYSPFLPVCMAAKSFPAAWTADAFLRLDALAAADRYVDDGQGNRQDVQAYYGDGVRAYWKTQEDRLVAEWPERLTEWSAAADEAGRAAATVGVNFQQLWTLADAKRLADELAAYCVEFHCDPTAGGESDLPTYPFASSVPTNAETGRAWTSRYQLEFDAYIEHMVGETGMRLPSVADLVEESKHVFDAVQNAASLAAAKARLQAIVESICEELVKAQSVPVIVSFQPDFAQGPTSEVPNVCWSITGSFDRVILTIDGAPVYDGDARCGEGRWRDVCLPGTHRLQLAVRFGDDEVSASCLYTALCEGDEPAVLPQIGYFYPDFYGGVEGTAPVVHWRADNITSVEIWVDAKCVLVTQDAVSEFRFSQLRNAGTHIVRIMAHNVTDDVESSFAYRTEAKPANPPAPLLQTPSVQTAESAPVIHEFHPDAYDASIRETPYIHWNLGGKVDSLQLTIDDTPVFIGAGNVASGRWLDVSGLNIDALSGSHEVTLSVSNSFGVVTSNFTCTCYWEEPPPPPMGSEENPWTIGENVQAYTNGFGTLVFIGEGATSNFTAAADLPWSGVAGSINSVSVPDSVSVIGANLWAGLGEDVLINGESIERRLAIAVGFPDGTVSGLISPAEFDAVEIVDGKVYLGVSVCTNGDLTAETESWGAAQLNPATVEQAEDGKGLVIPVPATAEKGFMILKSKAAK